MTWWQSVLLIFYCIALGTLLIYGAHRYFIVRLYYRNCHRTPRSPAPPDAWPTVTVQLPIFNELYVVERLLNSVAALDYPRELLQVQVAFLETVGME